MKKTSCVFNRFMLPKSKRNVKSVYVKNNFPILIAFDWYRIDMDEYIMNVTKL